MYSVLFKCSCTLIHSKKILR